MKFAKTLMGVAFATNLSFGSGIPVVDAAANAQMIKDSLAQVKTWAEEATRWSQTVKQYKDDLMAQAKELASKTGIRDAMNFAKEVKGVYDSFKSTGDEIKGVMESFDLSKADEKAFGLMTKALGEDVCKGYDDITQTNTCKKSKVAPWRETIAISNSLDNLGKLAKHLENLADEIGKNKGDQEDLKATADMTNQINLTIARLEAERSRIDLELAQSQRTKEQAERQQIEYSRKAGSGQLIDPNDKFIRLGRGN